MAAPKRTRRSTLDSSQNVTIDHSREEQCQNTYSNGVLSLLANLKQTDVATAGSISASFNPSILKEQTSKQRYRIAQYEPNIKVNASFGLNLIVVLDVVVVPEVLEQTNSRR